MIAIVWDLMPARPAATGTADGPRSAWWTGVATGIAAGIKLTPLIFVPYLLFTRRYREAAVASIAFVATIAAGFAVLPGASMTYWSRGLFARADGGTDQRVAFFFASARNQSLRGMLTRLLGSTQAATEPWLLAAIIVGAVGLLCAAGLHADGFPGLGLLTCALTALLVSPVSWDHHWVWAGPWLAVLAGMALMARGRSRWAWGGAAVMLTVTFAEWPAWSLAPGRTAGGLGLIRDVPMKTPFGWQGVSLIAGNLYVIAGCCGLLALLSWGIARAFQRGRTVGRPGGGSVLDGLRRDDPLPHVVSYRE
jgi:alpha-1,2-mannosyltransferase